MEGIAISPNVLRWGRCCEELSDVCLVTSDNPRTEDPLEIIRQITQGFQKESNYIVEPDRQAAIEKAIKMATLEDIVLIAGKGHENYQIFAHQTIEFDDAKIAQQTCLSLIHISEPTRPY